MSCRYIRPKKQYNASPLEDFPTFADPARRANVAGIRRRLAHSLGLDTSAPRRWRTVVASLRQREHIRSAVDEVEHREHSFVRSVSVLGHWTGRRPTGLLGSRAAVHPRSCAGLLPPSFVVSILFESP